MSAVKWFLLAVTYLCFVAELAFIIMGDTDHGILFAGLCFCLLVVFFVLWREEQTHKLLTLQNSLDDAQRGEGSGNRKKESDQVKRLRQEKEELTWERERANRRLEELTQEKETLTVRLAAAEQSRRDYAVKKEAESILPSGEDPVELDLAAVSARAVTGMEDACRKAGIRLSFSCSHETLFYKADERYICLMLQNIIRNSIQHMQRSGRLVITLSHLGDSIFFACKDDGVGLSQKETEHIFELNFRGSNRNGGNGLGLAQVRAIVRHLQGSVYARSTNGMGIYIELPLVEQTEGGGRGIQEEETGEAACERDGAFENTAGGE